MDRYGILQTFLRFLLLMFFPLRKAGEVYDVTSIVLFVFIITGVVATPIATLSLYTVPENVPRWILFLGIPSFILFILTFIAGFRLQYNTDLQHGRIYCALEKLAGLREEGVVLWHAGTELQNDKDVSDWIDKIHNWQSSATEQIAILSGVEARLFQTLRYWSAPSLNKYLNFNHSLNFRMLHRRLEIIEELIRRFSPK